jgi:hypothetical protein
MTALRVWVISAWIALPTVMYGGYSLLRILNRENHLSPLQVASFRAGHAHAGVLILMSLLYYVFIDRTGLPSALKHVACAVLVVGILAQSGGFFVHMAVGRPGHASIGSRVTALGGLLLTLSVAALVWGLIVAP